MNRNGQKINTISKTFPRIVDMIGLNDGVTDPRDKVVFHTLRHTFASWLVQSGVQLHIVGELLGHSTLEMTRRYSHLTPEIKSAAVGTIDSYL
ncbi:tyrosine-type recombinase/integrase [Desulfobulbus elongatus]|uniref:tyrosine-type recombinase/integrase n=1 Tax=Desulfobulbus elongatus TaxID=53332 RepID=UPI0009FD7E76